MRIAVMGSGLVGAAVARDLHAVDTYSVVALDSDSRRVTGLARYGVRGQVRDLSDPDTVRRVASEFDLVVGALPGRLGAGAVATILREGRPVVDISFFPEDPGELDRLARSSGVPCLIDCGVAPGLSNLILGWEESERGPLDSVESFRCLVGGLPVVREAPWEYKAPFSPADVIEEYTRPTRLRRNGRDLIRPELSELELVKLPGVDELEAFNTDGLRSLLSSSSVPDLSEKTLRYPGHAEKIRVLRDAGLFGEEPIRVAGGQDLVPRRITERLLFEAWQYEEGEPDLTIMRVEIEGTIKERAVRRTYDLLDYFNPVTGISSMARTTGYTCTAMVHLVAGGQWNRPGAFAPEAVGRAGYFSEVRQHLATRGVELGLKKEEL